MASASDGTAFRVILLNETKSTNDDCLKMADERAPDGTVVRALHQTAGRGRGGRTWHSQADASLTFSVLLRPTAREFAFLPRFPLLGCLALARTLEGNFKVQSSIKWPNDLLIAGKKVCGVLTETLWQNQIPNAVVIGMGINLTQDALPPEPNLIYPAGSLKGQADIRVSPQELLELLLTELPRVRAELSSNGFIEEINARLAFRGEWVTLRKNEDAPVKARPLWIEQDGSLRVEGENGKIERLYSAEISG